MKRNCLLFCAMVLIMACQPAKKEKDYTVAAYYFPNYHPGDARNNKVHGEGWSEWEVVKAARPRFQGQQQPRVPLWGYTDESDPVQMAQKITAAADHGVDAFIFDWYYYDDGPFLERGLEKGFMQAANNNRMKFGLMWANHDWTDIHPYTAGQPQRLLYPGKISPATWDTMTDYIISKYFKHPAYWMVQGAPYFSIYDLSKLLAIFGSAEATAEGLRRFREKTKAAGFPDLHLNAVVWGHTILPGEQTVADPARLIDQLGFNSVTSYVWIHHVSLDQFPYTAYDTVQKRYFQYAAEAASKFKVPYYPNVTVGWDSSPRTNQDKPFDIKAGYPYTPVISGNTPAAFEGALLQAREFLAKHPASGNIVTVNSWNEWTEGSYLEPDTATKTGYLEAIGRIFK